MMIEDGKSKVDHNFLISKLLKGSHSLPHPPVIIQIHNFHNYCVNVEFDSTLTVTLKTDLAPLEAAPFFAGPIEELC